MSPKQPQSTLLAFVALFVGILSFLAACLAATLRVKGIRMIVVQVNIPYLLQKKSPKKVYPLDMWFFLHLGRVFFPDTISHPVSRHFWVDDAPFSKGGICDTMWFFPGGYQLNTPWKIKMETKNWCFVDGFPLSMAFFRFHLNCQECRNWMQLRWPSK